MKLKHPRNIGILLGILYGLTIRYVFVGLSPYGLGVVSISFFFYVPFVIGYIRIHYELKINSNLTKWKMALIAWQPIFIFLFVTIITMLEGSICIAMALPAFMFFSSLGGLTAGLNNKLIKNNKGSLPAVVLLPFLLTPIESVFIDFSNTYEISNSIIIEALPEVVWRELGTVTSISESEIRIGITRLIGVPRPLSAEMSGTGVGSVRTSRWEKGVVFKEIITSWEPGKLMAYRFDIDPSLIPDTALDEHVKLGGEYFSPISGKYELSEYGENITLLTLSTVMRDNTNFGIYSRLWGKIIFSDFHNSLLKMMKSRSEGNS